MNTSSSQPINPVIWPVLGLVRFGLAMIVLACHVGFFYIARWAAFVTDMSAFVAVACFLVISGYSIAHSLAGHSNGFYRRRFARIYPLYAIAVIGPLLYQHVLLHHVLAGELHDTVYSLAFLQTFLTNLNPLNPVLWTLAIEMACYLLAPLLIRCNTAVLLAITAGSSLAFAAYPGISHPIYYAYLHHGAPLILLIWAWLAGFIFYRHQHDPSALVLLGFLMLLLPMINRLQVQNLYFIPVLAMVGAFYIAPRVRLPAVLAKVMLYFGELSYPLYVFHYPILVAVTARDRLAPYGPARPMLPGLYAVLAIAAASVVGVLIERRLRRETSVFLDRLCSYISRFTFKPRLEITPVVIDRPLETRA